MSVQKQWCNNNYLIMFTSLHNIQGAFALSRFYLIFITIFCLIISSYSVYKAFAFAELQREKIYVLDNGKSLMLSLSQHVLQNRLSEAKSHVKRLHDLLFTIPPSFSTIEYNIDQALRISDNSVLTVYKNRSESGFYDKLVGAGIINEIKLDSINVNMNSYPYSVKTYATTDRKSVV